LDFGPAFGVFFMGALLNVPFERQSGMFRFRETEEFSRWLESLRDARARAQILRRLSRATKGNFGDAEPVGEGISEMRVDVGAGYRVYYARAGRVVYVLLCGGDKGSQARDIAHAKRLWTQIKRSADHDEIP